MEATFREPSSDDLTGRTFAYDGDVGSIVGPTPTSRATEAIAIR